ncbi:uncharacterized protein LOC17898081 isoform X1 [Capsella rubella]|uniref:uncharacterized protein LOC17898081 isoform X1 n=1 Tax=Capsella rubella TaxID=81985 RepID=UPI000CD57ABF|nr:uncharacterized protein LOC17898081 isoform X1 [Capsella rubella]
MLKSKANTESKTSVWIDLNNCPIPDGYDAGQVRQRIESALHTIGDSGPLTINVLGTLENTPVDVLRALSSTGIVVHYIPRGTKTGGGCGKIVSVMLDWTVSNKPPAKIMFITDSLNVYYRSRTFSYLDEIGYEMLVVYGDTPKPHPALPSSLIWQWQSSSTVWQWQTLLEADPSRVHPTEGMDSGETITSLDDHKCPERDPGESDAFICRLCFDYTCLKYFKCQSLDDFTTHLDGEEHKLRYFYLHRIVHDEEEEDSLAGDDSSSLPVRDSSPHPVRDSSSHLKKSKKKSKHGVNSFHLMKAVTTMVMKNQLKQRKLKKKKKKTKKLE